MFSKCSFFLTVPKTLFKICSYIQTMTLDLIELLRASIYNSKHIKNMNIDFQTNLKNKKPYPPQRKKRKQRETAFDAGLYCIIYMLCWGPHSLTSLMIWESHWETILHAFVCRFSDPKNLDFWRPYGGPARFSCLKVSPVSTDGGGGGRIADNTKSKSVQKGDRCQ